MRNREQQILQETQERDREKRAAQEAEAAARRPQAPTTTVRSSGPRCPNKNCPNPKVVDGTCQTCGRVADDSNIVAEIQFGESSSGAAVVHGSYIGADQGGTRSLGPGFRRGGGSDQREKTLADARMTIQGIVAGLSLNKSSAPDQNIIDMSLQTFKLAAGLNFTQGRNLSVVCAVCVYTAFRTQTDDPNEKPKVMLLDLADLVKVNVFKLGRAYKRLIERVHLPHVNAIFPEDIIFRFACKLEFGSQTEKVAEDAIRLIKSMRKDWIIIGRRPSGICGACLLMAARMNNFRRTVREVVYVVKVTSHTIQERMKEFNETAASKMSVDDFLSPDFVESAVTSHDPPAFYRNTEEFRQKLEQQRKSRKKRKRAEGDDGSQERDGGSTTSGTPRPFRQQPVPGGPDLSSVPDLSQLYRRDDEGYLIPPLPPRVTDTTDPASQTAADADFEDLVKQFGDKADAGPGQPAVGTGEGTSRGRGRKNQPRLDIDQEWEGDEEDIEEDISEIMNDPETLEHAKAYANAEQRARLHAQWALQNEPSKGVSMDPTVGEDEFADDPEVANALLTPEEAKLKELLWVNENKDWLRLQQERIFQQKMLGDKPKRPRKARKPKLGEGQTSPASTPIEAAQNVMKYHGMSKRLNYDAISKVFNREGGASGTTSGQTSTANSVFGDAFREQEVEEVEEEEEEEEEEEYGNADGEGYTDYLDEYDEHGIDDVEEEYDNGGDED
ncbi:RNA polymerase III transcription initiation factor B complex component [Plectosphaerella plurivora]|uniref:RNA polymerase III transcription initiation factor B complex component n=1 Tax=Plectosphaerella plurivora TaxID=936078 RepID=A0A9P9A7I3_9PEZI|nr:RNA polymerase III transcription initiation factor B complex component [Plectosphaerella plurivora]